MYEIKKSPWLVWGLGAALFFSEYFGRVAPSVMVYELMSTFRVSHLELGTLSASFYIAYIGMQLPVGVLVDKFGPHRLLYSTAILCSLGTLLFALSNHILFAQLGRFIFGFGAAFAFVGTLKLASVWFPARRFGLLVGITQALGMLGAFVGAAPMSYAVSQFGWRTTLVMVAAIFLVLALLIKWIVRDKPDNFQDDDVTKNSDQQLLVTLKIILRNPQTWFIAIYVGFVFVPTAAFAEFWGVTFLVNTYHISTEFAALAVGLIFIGWGVGGPLMGCLSDYIKCRRPIMFASSLVGFLLIGVVLYIPALPIPVLFSCLLLYGLSNTGVAIGYAASAEINPRHTTGTSVAFANMASVMIGALLQPVIGWLIDLQWDGTMLNGYPVHQSYEFYRAFSILPACLLVGFICCFFIKETHCQFLSED